METTNTEKQLFAAYEDGNYVCDLAASSIAEAMEIHRGGVDRSAYPCDDSETIWVDLKVCGPDGEEICDTVQLDPEEPDCTDEDGHDWQSPHEVVGGLKENPGVRGNGGGVVITEVCAHCGAYKITDTCGQRPDTGEQGLTVIEYREADEKSLDWVNE